MDVGFKLATGQVEALKPSGVRLLSGVVRVFSGVEDPLLPGERGLRGPSWCGVRWWLAYLLHGSVLGGRGCSFLQPGRGVGGSIACCWACHYCLQLSLTLVSIRNALLTSAPVPLVLLYCPGARLMEQYQAQLVSALRAALAPTAGPLLSVAGGALATRFLESGLAAGGLVFCTVGFLEDGLSRVSCSLKGRPGSGMLGCLLAWLAGFPGYEWGVVD